MKNDKSLLSPHGGYRRLKSFQLSQLIFDVTVRFCDKYLDNQSRTNDQMTQAARSGVQNIAEGSQSSGTSKKTELRLTNVARASLEELKLDYEDFLRQRGLPQLKYDDPILKRFKKLQCSKIDEIRRWILEEKRKHQCPLSSATLVANACLSLLNITCYVLDQQIKKLAIDFENDGGFTEKLYRFRKSKRAGF